MNGWLLDTNVLAALINPNGAPAVKGWATGQPEERMFLSILTLGEYEKGIHNLPSDDPRRSRYMVLLHGIEQRFAGRIIPLDDATVRRWGRISGMVKQRTGHAPSVIDTLLAATALTHDLFLATRNVKDVQHSGAAVFNPWADDPAGFPLARTHGARHPPT